MKRFPDTSADIEIKECINESRSFSVIAGAGSGKTTSLITALDYIRVNHGKSLIRNAQKVACITYTNRAVDVIRSRLNDDDLFVVSTLHGFMWGEIHRFQVDIKKAVKEYLIPKQIAKKLADDNGGRSQKALKARKRVEELRTVMDQIDDLERITYHDNQYSDFGKGKLGHDDIIAITGYLLEKNNVVQKILGQKYPYVFIDEVQDTFVSIMEAFNTASNSHGRPVLGYFGDPMQQIYDGRAGDFFGPTGSSGITKKENFRCSLSVIKLLNAFRTDIQQVPGDSNRGVIGSVEIILIQSGPGEGPRKTYSETQLRDVSIKFDKAREMLGWNEVRDVKYLFLARQMIARRLGFSSLQKLFSGPYASTNAKDRFDKGEHFLVKPLLSYLYPLVSSYKQDDLSSVHSLIRKNSPAHALFSENDSRSVADVVSEIKGIVDGLVKLWDRADIGSIYKYCMKKNILNHSDILFEHLKREPRNEDFDNKLHDAEKGDWLADELFRHTTEEIEPYIDFLNDNTLFSTQHGVKGEEYKDVLVVFDDTEAYWNSYSFSKTLAPVASGAEPTEKQLSRSQKLAYVCFSRALENLRIVLYTPNAAVARDEMVSRGLIQSDQISIL